MKKKIFTLFLFAFLTLACLSACNSQSNIRGQFKKENYIVSIEDTIDFFEELTTSGIDKANVKISSSNIDVMKETDEGVFEACGSGQSYIFAKNGDKIIAKTKVSVKYKFSSPKNVQIDNNGKLSWDKSYVVINNQSVFANGYQLSYKRTDIAGAQQKSIVLEQNSFQFDEIGVYQISLAVIADVTNNIDGSEKVEMTVCHGVMQTVSGEKIANKEEIKNQVSTFSWDAVENANYDVYLEGFKIFENLTEPQFDFDYSRYKSDSTLEIKIVIKDDKDEKLPSISTFNIQKLKTPAVEYSFDGKDGFIKWSGDENAKQYILKITDFNAQSWIRKVENEEEINELLADCEGGAYNIEVMAVGDADKGLYLNSNTTDAITVAKIENPEVQVEFIGKSVRITFPSDAYSSRYRISVGSINTIYDTKFGFTQTVNLSTLPVGSYKVEVVALPNVSVSSVTGAEELQYGEVVSQKVINSNAFLYDYFVLEEFSEIYHALSENVSTVYFNEIENANIYELYINDVLVKNATQESKDGKRYISFEDLNKYSPVDNKYTFKVVCGRMVDGEERAVRNEKIKDLTILDPVTESASQTNGFFSWNNADGNCEYYFEVYKTDKNYQILTPELPFISGTTSSNITSPILDLGYYYTIKVYTLSCDENLYLDATFVDQNAFFTQNFFATKQIEEPDVTFAVSGNDYILNISQVEYGGRYEIFVDGVSEGEFFVSDIKENYVYKIENTFAEAKNYEIAVVASCGLLYDKNLYLDSEESQLFVERLALPEFEIEIVQDVFGRKTNENIVFNQTVNSSAVKVILNSEVISEEGYILDVKDASKFGSEFTLTAIVVAGENDENQYIIDSLPQDFKFERLIAPTAINFDNGYLNWTSYDPGPIDYFEILITFVNSNSSNYYKSFQIPGLDHYEENFTFNIQATLNSLISSDSALKTAYRQSEKLQVEIRSYLHGTVSGVHKLPSVAGITTKGENILDILTLEKPTLSFNIDSKTLSWTEEKEDSVYDIYVDGKVAVKGYETNSIDLSKLGEYDYLTPKSISVKAYNSAYLDSETSEPIIIEEITIDKALNIGKTEEGYVASINISSDQAYVQDVLVNGSKENVEFTKGTNLVKFKFADFENINNFNIQLKAKNESSTNYYLDSKIISFNVENISNKTFELTRTENTISWQDFRNDLIGNSIQPIVYTVYVQNGDMQYDFVTETCSITLNEIESKISAELSSELKINVLAKVQKDYYLQDKGEGTFGYYGEILSSQITSYKLDEVSVSSVKVIEENRTSSLLKQKTLAGIEIVFEDKWTSFEGVQFVLTWEYTNENGMNKKVKLTYNDKLEEFAYGKTTKVDNNYHLTIIASDYNAEVNPLSFFSASTTNVQIVVKKEGLIDSEISSFNVCRFADMEGTFVSDEGILEISDTQSNASYFIELKLSDGQLIYKTLLASEIKGNKTLNLLTEEFFVGKTTGEYQIQIIAFDENEIILPSRIVEKFTGNKVDGIESLSIDDNGNITIKLFPADFSNIVFTARVEVDGEYIKKDFLPTEVSGSQTDYQISMIEIIELFENDVTFTNSSYTFDFTVRSEGSINADWKPLTFSYKLGDSPKLSRAIDLNKDYIINDLGDSSIENTVFFIRISGLFKNEEENVKETRKIYYSPSDIHGYWMTESNGSYFETSLSTGISEYLECYGINVNALLSEILYGDVNIKIARVGKLNGEYYQFNCNSFDVYKLNKINDDSSEQAEAFAIKDNMLSWKWEQQDNEVSDASYIPTSYYIEFKHAILNSITRFLVTTNKIDLRSLSLPSGNPYYVSVIAVNGSNNIVASDISREIFTMRYTSPPSLEVVDGKIVYDVSEFLSSDFMDDIVDFFGSAVPEQAYHNIVGLATYMSPLYFTPQSLGDAKVKLKFTSVVEGGTTNTSYYVTINAVTLFPDIEIDLATTTYSEDGASYSNTYAKALKKYYDLNSLQNLDTLEWRNTSSMINAISLSNLGLCDDAVLVDDFGRFIPEGEYMVSALQTGEYQFIESDYSSATKIYISASPELSLQTESDEAGKTLYTALITPTYNMINVDGNYQKQLATKYKMQLRYQTANGIYDAEDFVNLIIEYSGSEWSISYDGTQLKNVISSVNWEANIPKFKLNMNNLRTELNKIDSSLIKVNELLEVNIFTYSQDDGYVVNGKSAKFNLRYLDLKTDVIKFIDGDFIVNAGLDSSYQMLIQYKITSQEQSSFKQNFENGMVKIIFEKSGVYEYVVLSLNGSVSPSIMNVASDSYVIKNLYKLNTPSLTTKNNNINISYGNSDDILYINTLKFNLANNISLHNSYKKAEDAGYYYSSDITSTNSIVPYVVGSKDVNDQTLYPSELMADEFFVYLSGNTGSFSLSEEKVSEGDYLLEFSQSRAVMSSSVSSIEAIMLPYLSGIALSDGDFYLDDAMVGINAVTDAEFNDRSGNIVYEIIATYYGIDNTNGNSLMELYEETVYSERMYADERMSFAQIVDSGFIKAQYDYFTIGVSVLGALHTTADHPDAIKTLEGTYILLNDSVYTGPNTEYPSAEYGQHVLRSQALVTPIITRTTAPFLSKDSNGVSNNGILNGEIKFVIDKSLYYTDDSLSVAQNTANRIKIYAKYTYNGETVQEEVSGSIRFETSSVSGTQDYIFVSVLPDDGLFANASGTIDFYVTIHGNNSIKSVPLVIDNVFKLPKVEEKYYTVDLVGDKTYLDFAGYFNNISIANDTSCYKIVIYYTTDSEQEPIEFFNYTMPKQFELASNVTSIRIQAQDGQDYSTLNSKKLLYSDSISLNVKQTVLNKDILDLTWNSKEMRFEWSWIDGNSDKFEYYVRLNYESGKEESAIVNTNYYMPQNRGIIKSGGFEIKARKKTDNTDIIYSFSAGLKYEGEDLQYNLFSGGNGTENNPYLISNATDFVNIAKRNSADKQFYFKLSNNIELNVKDVYIDDNGVLVPIIKEFYGVLDGNGYKLSLNAANVSDLDETFAGSIVGMDKLNFNKFSSIFYSIDEIAMIKNLYIDYKITYGSLNSSNIMFSPLATFNYGTIDNVYLTNFEINTLKGSGENNVFVGGIVGVNYGVIQNCANTATFTYLMAQQLALNFGYGGMCIYNSNQGNISGTISNCFNQGDKEITQRANNNLVYMAGMTISNSGKISTSGNDGSLKLSSLGTGVTTFTGYFAGITVQSNNGILEYLYNNGLIENLSNYGYLNVGGIAYQVARGSLNTLIVTVSGQPIIKSCSSKPTIIGTNFYATNNSGTHAFITTRELSAQTITCSNGSELKIIQTDSGFVASIS